MAPPNFTSASWEGSPERAPEAALNTNTAKRSRTVTRSRTRSRMIVANADVALSDSRRARRYGLNTSPTLPGIIELAAKPITVVSNAFQYRVRPMGASRNCHRRARIVYVKAVITTETVNNKPSARRTSAHTAAGLALRKKYARSPIVRRKMTMVRIRGRMRVNRPRANPRPPPRRPIRTGRVNADTNKGECSTFGYSKRKTREL